MKQHTPGPWKRRDSRTESGQRTIEIWRHEPNESPITRIATVHTQPVPIKHGDHVLNALLIAAAPELLEALTSMVDMFERHIDGRPGPDDAAQRWDAARSAIAKATGETVEA